ncbi:hypothetical protein DFQ26_009536 [Actinomortierella ambigua]|nr:hypothetical protein DFQ26_009536 [Actinomortierella ambigua]
MLVCRSWQRRFEELTWRHLIYNRAGVSNLESKGYLVNTLQAYFPLDDFHLSTIASSCPNIVSLDIEISPMASPEVVDLFMASMGTVQDLRLILKDKSEPGFLCSLTRMDSLRKLHLAGRGYSQLSKDPQWLITLLQALPTLQHMSMDTSLQESSPPAGRNITFKPIRGSEYNVAAEPSSWKQWLQSLAGQSKGSLEILRYRQELERAQRKEPWRKFVPLRLPPLEDEAPMAAAPPVLPPACYSLLDQSPIGHQPIGHLTSLVLSKTATPLIPVIASTLFPLLPRLQEVTMTFPANFRHTPLGLACLAEHCRALRSIRFECIFPTLGRAVNTYANPPTLSGIASESALGADMLAFFRNMPPRIRSLSLLECALFDSCLRDIPTESLRELVTLELKNTGTCQVTVDEFLARCPCLRTLKLASLYRPSPFGTKMPTWDDCTTLAVLSRGDQFLGNELRPTWECTWTMRQVHIDEWRIVEVAAFNTLFDRIEAMPCLTWLSLSLCQARQLISDSMHRKLYLDDSDDSGYIKEEEEEGPRAAAVAKAPEPPTLVRWNFINLLDLRLVMTSSYGRMTDENYTRLLCVMELKCLFLSMPKLRRLWYSSSGYPLDKATDQWFKEKHKDMSIQHCSSKF